MNKRQRKKQAKKEQEQLIKLVNNIDWSGFYKACEKVAETINICFEKATEFVKQVAERLTKEAEELKKEQEVDNAQN